MHVVPVLSSRMTMLFQARLCSGLSMVAFLHAFSASTCLFWSAYCRSRKKERCHTVLPFYYFPSFISFFFFPFTFCSSFLKRLQENNVRVPYQASKVVVAVWVFFPKADGVPVALLRLFELPQAVLNDAQIHPSRRKVASATDCEGKKNKLESVKKEVLPVNDKDSLSGF